MDQNFTSVLHLAGMAFDRLEFTRKGPKNQESQLSYSFQVKMAKHNSIDRYRVTLQFDGEKPSEYTLHLSLLGFFEIKGQDSLGSEFCASLIEKNAVAILMPYLRSQISILTAQPGVDPVVLPPFNINAMLKDSDDSPEQP